MTTKAVEEILKEYPFYQEYLKTDDFLKFRDNLMFFDKELRAKGVTEDDLSLLMTPPDVPTKGMLFLRNIHFPIDSHPDFARFLASHYSDIVEMKDAKDSDAAALFRHGILAVEHMVNEKTWPMVKKGFIEMARAAESNAGYLFGYGILSVKPIINEKTWPMITKGFIEMARAAGNNSGVLFQDGIFAIKDLINEKTWPYFVEMAKGAKENSGALFKISIPAVKDMINETNLPMVTKGFVEMAKAAGNNSGILFQYGIPLVKDLINERTWPIFVKMVKAAGERSEVLFSAIILVKDLISDNNLSAVAEILLVIIRDNPVLLQKEHLLHSFVERSLNGEKLDIETFLRGHVQEKFGFIPTGDIQGIMKLAITEFTDDKIRRINRVFSGKIEKHFPLGKVYGEVSVSGIAELSDPVELTMILVSVLLTPDKSENVPIIERLRDKRYVRFLRNVAKAKSVFDMNKLEVARKYVLTSNLNTRKIFNDIKDDFERVKESGDKDAAERIIKYFEEIVKKGHEGKIEPLSDIVMGIKSLFNESFKFNRVVAKMQSGVVTDLFDSNNTMCCAFYPDGANKSASIGYLEDPYIGLLQLKAAQKSLFKEIVEVEIIGVAILVLCVDENGKRVLLVDSVEGNGEYLGVMKTSVWKELFYNSILQIAKDTESAYILFNASISNTTPERFNAFLEEQGLQKAKILLKKLGTPKGRYIESFGEWEEGLGGLVYMGLENSEGSVEGFIKESN